MKKRLVIQSFIITLIVLIAVFIASVCTFYYIQQQKLKETLVSQTQLIKTLYEENPQALFSLSLPDTRITVISLEGDVLFDSSKENTEDFDNHISREEIVAALNGSPEVVKRYSDTLKRNMFYYALTAQSADSEQVLLRVAQPESNVWSYTGTGIIYICIGIIFAVVVSYLLAQRLSDKVNSQLKYLQDNLRSINSGDYTAITPPDKDALNLSILSEMNEIVKNLQRSYDGMQNEKTKLYNIIDNMTQGVIVTDAEGKVTLINKVASSLFGAKENLTALKDVFDDENLFDAVSLALTEKTSSPIEYVYKDKDLAINTFSIALSGTEDKQNVILISDVSKEKELSRQKSVFFANASHELKTPLTSVQGLSESLLARMDENSPYFKYLKRIYTESVRLHNIVMDMLYISKLESKNIDRSHEAVSLKKVVEDSLLSYATEAEEKSLKITSEGEAVVSGDYHNLYELINNLIGNAVHYNKQGGSIEISLGQTQNECTIRISDTGIGIAPEHIPHICERFYRVDKSRSKSTGGTGLGLAIVKHIVMLYNGKLDIESTLGKGTVVSVVLPCDVNNV